jgi:hypothetical protein
MRRVPTFVAAAAVALMIGGVSNASAHQRSGGPPPTASFVPSGTGAISGVVIDATTGRPLEGAIVSLGLTSGGPVILTLPRVLTDPKGRFLFRDLAPSQRYYIRAALVGYAPIRYGAPGPSVPTSFSDMEIRTVDDISVIGVAADQWVSDIKVSLWRLGSISGRVGDERSEPVVGVAVRAFSTVMVAGHAQYVGGDVATTDDRGEYRLANLLPGKYAVAVLSVQSTVPDSTPEGAQKRAAGELSVRGLTGVNTGLPAVDGDERHRLVISNFATPPPPRAGIRRAYPAVFYPGTATLATSQPVEVGYGTSRHSVDFQLRPVAAVTVSGHVVPPSGDPSASTALRLMPAGNEQLGVGSEAATTVVEPDGSFTFLNVPAGDYTLMTQASMGEFTSGSGEALIPGPPGAQSGGGMFGWVSGAPGLSLVDRGGPPQNMWGRTALVVGDHDLSDVVLPLHPTVTVRGRVVMAGGTSAGQQRLSTMVNAQPANGDPLLGRATVFLTVSDEAPFTLAGLAGGRYLLSLPFLARAGISIASIMANGQDVRDTGLDASLGTDFNDVVITLVNKTIELSGTVSGHDAATPAGVIAFPVDRARWTDYGWDPTMIISKSLDSAGAFVVTGLPEGDYFVVAVPSSQHDAWTDPAFLDAASKVATRVSLKWGDKTSVDLSIAKVVVK